MLKYCRRFLEAAADDLVPEAGQKGRLEDGGEPGAEEDGAGHFLEDGVCLEVLQQLWVLLQQFVEAALDGLPVRGVEVQELMH